MGCNCKAQNNFNKIVSKYGDALPDKIEGRVGFRGIIDACMNAIGQILTGILLCVLFIIIAVPIVFYIGGCMIVGKEAHIKLLNFKKNKKNDSK